MNRKLISVYLLLATLFMVNAINAIPLDKRETHFNDCPLTDKATLTVTVVPDPVVAKSNVAFSVFGTLNYPVVAGKTVLAIGFADSTGRTILTPVYYEIFSKPYGAGEIVSISVSDVVAPDELPDVYTIGVAIGNPALGNPITPLDIFGCSYAVVGGS